MLSKVVIFIVVNCFSICYFLLSLNTSMRSATPWHSTTRRFSTKKPCSQVLKNQCASTFM